LDTEKLKKLLAGLGIAALLANAGLTLPGCSSHGKSG
jgi:radical SAM modification target selenobiotic family peptide